MAARLRWSKASEMFAKGRRRTIRFLEPIRTLTTRTGSSHSATRITSTFSTDSGQEDESAEDRTAHKRPRRNRTKERELRATASTGSMGSYDGEWKPVGVINPAAGYGYDTDATDVSQAGYQECARIRLGEEQTRHLNRRRWGRGQE